MNKSSSAAVDVQPQGGPHAAGERRQRVGVQVRLADPLLVEAVGAGAEREGAGPFALGGPDAAREAALVLVDELQRLVVVAVPEGGLD